MYAGFSTGKISTERVQWLSVRESFDPHGHTPDLLLGFSSNTVNRTVCMDMERSRQRFQKTSGVTPLPILLSSCTKVYPFSHT